jgi:ribosomal protein L29
MQENEQIKSPVKQRILSFAETLGISKRKFYATIGVSRGTLENNTGITEDIVAKFIAVYANVSIEWLFTGNGSMIREEQTSPQSVVSQANEFYKELYEKIYEENKALLQKVGKMGGEIEMLKKTNEQLKNGILSLKEELLQEQTESFTLSVAGSEQKMPSARANIADAPFSRKRQNPQIEK